MSGKCFALRLLGILSVGLVLSLAHAEEHGEEVPGVAEVVVRVDPRITAGVPVGIRRDGGELSDESSRLQAT